jgi:ATP-dependent Clp protease adaptor protein ClpS
MPDIDLKPKGETATRPARPPLYRVLLVNDDFTPRDFVVGVLRRVFRLNAEQARAVMLTAHQRGVCVVAIYTRDVAETKADQATEEGRQEGYPLTFQIEPETGGED